MIQKNDFIEIEYTGRTKDEDFVFDTTDEKIAEEAGIKQDDATYGKVMICIGQGNVIPALDDKLIGKEIGKEIEIILEPDEAFGKKSAKLVQLIPTRKFSESKISPQPGLQVNIDGMTGIIKHVSGGRTMVDFNHPLSSKSIKYNINIIRKVEDDTEKLDGYLKLILGQQDIKVKIQDSKALIESKNEIPKEVQKELSNKIKDLIPNIKDLEFKKLVDKPANK